MGDAIDFAKFIIENGEKLTLVVVLVLFIFGGVVLFLRGYLASPQEIARLRAECDAKEAAIVKAGAEFGDTRVTLAKAEVAMEYQAKRITELEKDRDACRERLQRRELEADIRQGWTRNPTPGSEAP
jgi:hypothetical protein